MGSCSVGAVSRHPPRRRAGLPVAAAHGVDGAGDHVAGGRPRQRRAGWLRYWCAVDLLVPIAFGVGVAAVPMVGMAVGADVARARRVAWSAACVSAVLLGSVGLLLVAWPDLWARLFTADPGVLTHARSYLRWAGAGFTFFGIGLTLYFAAQGAGDVLLRRWRLRSCGSCLSWPEARCSWPWVPGHGPCSRWWVWRWWSMAAPRPWACGARAGGRWADVVRGRVTPGQ